jgi:predicted nuclease of predicted toxin-antitoxin system
MKILIDMNLSPQWVEAFAAVQIESNSLVNSWRSITSNH